MQSVSIIRSPTAECSVLELIDAYVLEQRRDSGCGEIIILHRLGRRTNLHDIADLRKIVLYNVTAVLAREQTKGSQAGHHSLMTRPESLVNPHYSTVSVHRP